ncbi:extracellular solute-binding protein [Paenibacillus sp. FSL H8-0034]|uniref:extracellular solute-binding protein n=1 Tax=Paenibacillus sp. FSL H8-0034 TaxID=2954671 RepID=UPI0030F5D593
MKKRIVATLVLIPALFLTACSNSAEKPAGDAKNTEMKKKDITVLLTHVDGVFATQRPASDHKIYFDELNRLSGRNIKYDFLSWGGGNDYKQQLALRFASGDLADLVRTDSIDSSVHRGAVDQGAFLQLDELIDKYGPHLKTKIPKVSWDSPRVKKDGKTYGIPVTSGWPATRVMFYRQDWLDELGMEPPKTLDEFLKYAEGIKQKDMNKDGDPNNEYALPLNDNLEYSDILSGAFGVRPGAWQMRNGRMEPDVIQPQMKEAVAFYKKLYDSGYIQKDFATKKQSERTAEIYKGQYGAFTALVDHYVRFDGASKYLNQPNAKITMAAPPKGAKGESYADLENEQIDFVWVIPANTKNPEEVIQFLDWAWSSPEADQFFAFGVKGHNYTEENGQVKYDPSAPANSQNNAYEFFQKHMNFREVGVTNPKVVSMLPDSKKILKAYADAESAIYKHASLGMPILKALDGHPELTPNLTGGSLFSDGFVRWVVGREDLNTGFEKFVNDWKQRGGEQAIKEATEWYQKKK